jgi:hypothetical protein
VEELQQAARQKAARLATAKFEIERRAKIARLIAEKQKAMRAAAAAEQARLAKIEADNRAAAQKKAAEERVAQQVEDHLQAARQRIAREATVNFELARHAEAVPTITGSIGKSAASAQNPAGPAGAKADDQGQSKRPARSALAETNARSAPDGAGPGESGAGGQRTKALPKKADSNEPRVIGPDDNRAAEPAGGAAKYATSAVASLGDGAGGEYRAILNRRCTSILQSPDAYDDDLVALCLTWSGAKDHVASGAAAGPAVKEVSDDRTGSIGVPPSGAGYRWRGPAGTRSGQLFKRRCQFIMQRPEYSRELIRMCGLAQRR